MSPLRKSKKSKYTEDRNIPGAFEGETVTRRRFMTLSAHNAGGIAAAAFTLPALGFAAGSALFERPKVIWQRIGKPSDFNPDSYVPRTIEIVSGVGEIGKSTVYVRIHNDKVDGVATRKSDPFIVLSTRCMHLGCPVRYVEAAERFICPCHGGVYDFLGQRTGGPPVRPLDRFYTRVVNGYLEVGPRYSVNNHFTRFPSYRDPGQNLNLDGIGPVLYPGRFSTPKLKGT